MHACVRVRVNHLQKQKRKKKLSHLELVHALREVKCAAATLGGLHAQLVGKQRSVIIVCRIVCVVSEYSF
jgi:hypothetical protein